MAIEQEDGYPYDDEDTDGGYCYRCDNQGFIVTCIDDMCRGAGECMHGDGETICPDCKGRQRMVNGREYRRKLIEHNTAVQAALAATTEPVRQHLKRYRLDLYPLDWLKDEIAALETMLSQATEPPSSAGAIDPSAADPGTLPTREKSS